MKASPTPVSWIVPVRFPWHGTFMAGDREIEFISTWYGANTYRKGDLPPPRLMAKLDARVAEALTRWAPSIAVMARALVKLWNDQWRVANSRVSVAQMRTMLEPVRLLLNGGENGPEYMVFFRPLEVFGGRIPQLTVARGNVRNVSLDSPRDAKGTPLLPFVGVEKEFATLPKARPRSPAAPRAGALRVAKPASLAWRRTPTWEAQHQAFQGAISLDGKRVAVSMESGREGARALAIATDRLAAIVGALPGLRSQAATRIAALHEESWLDSRKPPMTEQEVLRRIRLTRIEARGGGRFGLVFTDGRIFAGHTIEISGSGSKVRVLDLLG